MESQLLAALDRNNVTQETKDFMLAMNCSSSAIFANWVDEASELAKAIWEKSPKKDDVAELARLKMTWRQVEALVTKSIKRSSEGLSTEDLDEPLDSGVARGIIDTFTKLYDWPELPNEWMGSDSLFARIRREFEKAQPSMYSVARVRSIANSMRSTPSKRTRISDEVTIDYKTDEGACVVDLQATAHLIREYFVKITILMNTMAVAGTFEVHFQGSQVRYAHWSETTAYIRGLEKTAWALVGRFTDQSIVDYISAADEQFRSRAIELSRSSSKIPWGKALGSAAAEKADVWRELRDLLHPISHSRPVLPLADDGHPKGPGGPKGGGKGPKGKNKATTKASAAPAVYLTPSTLPTKQWKTGTYGPDNWTLCKKFNDKRGCKGPRCPDNNKHGCDVVLAKSSQVCGLGHPRSQHNPSSHGAPAQR